MKKLKNVIFWAGIFITILTYILVKPLSDLDEIWNFNIARCIANGLVPYKDISMVTTPLLGYITAIFLKICGGEMFITRVLAAILAVMCLGLVYKICRKLEVSRTLSNLLVLALVFILRNYFCLDYNFLVLTIALLIILFEIRNCNKSSIKLNILIGVLGGLSICCKQSIGVLICGVIIFNQLFFIKRKSNLKEIFKIIAFRIIGICIPITIFSVYLIYSNSYREFWDYCIAGIKTFSNKIAYANLLKSDNLLIKILSICAPLTLIIITVVNIVFRCLNKERKFLYLLNVYCFPIFAISYPISDNIHFLISIVPLFILLIYVISLGIKKLEKLRLNYLWDLIDIISILWVIAFTLYIELINLESLGNLSKYTNINHFKYIYTSNDINNSINEMKDFINSSDKKVYILDSSAALYMIPIDKYNKNYDMFNKGNFGANGEQGQIDNIKKEDAKFLILKEDYGRNWQNPEDVRSFVKENLNCTGSVGVYDVYEH